MVDLTGVRMRACAVLVLGSLHACAGIEQPAVMQSKAILCVSSGGHHDGDTFKCTTDAFPNQPLTVRVAGVDAPETGQAYWRVARARLRELATLGSTVDCYKADRYGRSVCRLTSSDGRDAANVMLAEGLVWYPEAYAH